MSRRKRKGLSSVIGCALAAMLVASAASAAGLVGNAERGKTLFMGQTRFVNGGPPCMACHSVAGVGALGGGAMGPDLTTGYARFRDFVIYPPRMTPAMKPIFSVHPLSPQEEADLIAFFKAASIPQRTTSNMLYLGLMAAGLAILFLIVLHLVWYRRVADVRKQLVLSRR